VDHEAATSASSRESLPTTPAVPVQVADSAADAAFIAAAAAHEGPEKAAWPQFATAEPHQNPPFSAGMCWGDARRGGPSTGAKLDSRIAQEWDMQKSTGQIVFHGSWEARQQEQIQVRDTARATLCTHRSCVRRLCRGWVAYTGVRFDRRQGAQSVWVAKSSDRVSAETSLRLFTEKLQCKPFQQPQPNPPEVSKSFVRTLSFRTLAQGRLSSSAPSGLSGRPSRSD
jgi:hypothetical protein